MGNNETVSKGLGPPPRPQEIGPGHFEASLFAWTEGEEPDDELFRRAMEVARERGIREPGRTLAEMRAEFGGDEGFVNGPERQGRFAVSLAPWRDADPDRTRLMPRFRWVPDDPEAFTDAWLARQDRQSGENGA